MKQPWVYMCSPSPHMHILFFFSLFSSIGLFVYLCANTTMLLLLLFSHEVVSNSLRPHGLQHVRLPFPSLSPRVCSNSCPLSQWYHPTISSSITPFSCLQSFPESGSFPVSWLFTSGAQSIGALVSASVPPMSIHGWFPLELTGSISIQSKWLSRVFSSTTIRRHQFFGTWPFLMVRLSHPYTTIGKTIALILAFRRQSDVSVF